MSAWSFPAICFNIPYRRRQIILSNPFPFQTDFVELSKHALLSKQVARPTPSSLSIAIFAFESNVVTFILHSAKMKMRVGFKRKTSSRQTRHIQPESKSIETINFKAWACSVARKLFMSSDRVIWRGDVRDDGEAWLIIARTQTVITAIVFSRRPGKAASSSQSSAVWKSSVVCVWEKAQRCDGNNRAVINKRIAIRQLTSTDKISGTASAHCSTKTKPWKFLRLRDKICSNFHARAVLLVE